MVKKIFLFACLFSLSFTVPAMAASSKAKLLTDTSSSANTVPFINAGPAEDSTAATGLGVQVNSTEMMRVTATGSVGIGTTTPTTALQVNGTVAATAFSGPITSVSDVTASRSLGTIYQNTKGKTLVISVCAVRTNLTGVSNTMTAYIGATSSSLFPVANQSFMGTGGAEELVFFVPSGYFYKVTLDTGATVVIYYWTEYVLPI